MALLVVFLSWIEHKIKNFTKFHKIINKSSQDQIPHKIIIQSLYRLQICLLLSLELQTLKEQRGFSNITPCSDHFVICALENQLLCCVVLYRVSCLKELKNKIDE